MTSNSSDRLDVYTAITNQIIAAVEAGADHPQMPWHCSGSVIERPINVASGKSYRGVNTVALWATAYCQQYRTGLWGTYRQWQERGAQVRKGEKSSIIIFYKDLEASSGESSDDQQSRWFVARASRVFNVAQVDGYVAAQIDESVDPVHPCERAESLIASSGAHIRIGGHRAYFDPAEDYIAMPDRFRFVGTETSSASEGWYSTLLHELTHWSGAEHRIDRQLGERFGDDAYAMEEMVALSGQSAPSATLQ